MAKLRKQKTEEVEAVEVKESQKPEEVEEVETPDEEVENEETLEEISKEKEAKESKEKIDVIDNAVKTSQANKEAEVEQPKTVKEPQVRINPKQDIRSHIGDQWYNLKAGKIVSVPRTVKVKLERAGMLNPV